MSIELVNHLENKPANEVATWSIRCRYQALGKRLVARIGVLACLIVPFVGEVADSMLASDCSRCIPTLWDMLGVRK